MSHRRPPTRADRLIASLEDMHPELARIAPAPCHTFSTEAMGAMHRIQAREHRVTPTDPSEMMRAILEDPTFVLPEDVALWSQWQVSRQVFRFDAALSAELAATPCPDDMPLDALRKLPYPCLFVEAGIELPLSSGRTGEADGFFCWQDRTMRNGATSIEDTVECLTFMLANRDRPRSYVYLELYAGCLGEAIERVVAQDEAADLANAGGGTVVVRSGDQREKARRQLSLLCSHLLYIASDGSVQEVVYRPAGNAPARRKGRPQAASTVHEVGTRVGRSLGQERVRYVGREGQLPPDGTRTVATHMGAGHWHHYWRGPKRDPEARELIVRWVAPILVNAGSAPGATVVHDAG